jgi:signal peptidase II
MKWALALLVLVIDLVTKYLTQKELPLMSHSPPVYPYGGIPVFHDVLGVEFSLVHATNKGAAWGVLADYSQALFVARLLLIGVLLVYFVRPKSSLWQQLPLALIIAGAIGNVIDYFAYGHVVDMFHFILWGYDYPVFNVADSAIFLGILLYLIFSWMPSNASARRTS